MLQKQIRFTRLGIKSLKSRSIRSWITIVGIVISIAVILTLLTLSAGLQYAVVKLFEDLGTDRIFIMGADANPRGLEQTKLTTDTVDHIRAMGQFELVIPRLILPAQKVEFLGDYKYATIGDFEPEIIDKVNEEYQLIDDLESGRLLSKTDKYSVVVGGAVASTDKDNFGDSFRKQIRPQNSILIGGESFKVVGVFKKNGGNFDNIILTSIDALREISNKTDTVSVIDAVVKPGVDMEDAKNRLDRKLEKLLGEDNYLIITPESILRQFTNTMNIVQIILLAIASVSLIVGAVGIMNTMFTSVLEREKEIGIIKSIGCRNRDVMQLFLIESGLIGLIGGIAGVILGIGISYAVGAIAAASGFEFLIIKISIIDVIGCLLFAFVIGMISGILPSYLASRKKIVDVLRDS